MESAQSAALLLLPLLVQADDYLSPVMLPAELQARLDIELRRWS